MLGWRLVVVQVFDFLELPIFYSAAKLPPQRFPPTCAAVFFKLVSSAEKLRRENVSPFGKAETRVMISSLRSSSMVLPYSLHVSQVYTRLNVSFVEAAMQQGRSNGTAGMGRSKSLLAIP